MADVSGISPVKRFLNLLKVEKQDILSIYIYAVFRGVVSLSLPLGMQAIINLITVGQISTSWVVLVIIVLGGVAMSGGLQIVQLRITENLQQKIFTRSAFEFAYRLPRLKLEAVNRAYVPELVNRFFDIVSVQKGLTKILIDFSSATLQVVFGLIILSFYHPFFIFYSLILIGIMFLIFRFTAPMGLQTSIKESKYKYEVAFWLEEIGRTLETFKLAGNSGLPLKRTDAVVEKYLESRNSHFRVLVIQFINMVGFKVLVAAGLLIIGGLLVINRQMNIGQFVASEIIIILIMDSVEKLITSMDTIYDVLTSIEKVGNVTDLPLEKNGGYEPEVSDKGPMVVIFKDVSYRFAGQDTAVIKPLRLEIKPGQKVCLAGYSGSGKSQLLHLMAGLYENYEGSILYNHIPLQDWNREVLYASIGSSFSREDIFKGSLIENITLNKPNVTLAEVQQAVDVLNLDSFVDSLPEGYHSILFTEGKNLPQSIRLKIKLARTLVGKPDLLLVGDHLNQLHQADKDKFLDFILSKPWTVVAVSNRLEVARKFDSTLLLDNGTLVADSTAESLAASPAFHNVFLIS